MTSITTQTLYRTYRPQSFDQIIGQEEIVTTLQNQISRGSIAHAYLFCGGRGTGKTSIARIFASALGTDKQDVYEIDAASNRGIGEIREIRDGVANRPFSSQYKVYIIDEVHMLTKEAFNALLKTLEEPPAHVIFILATTEKRKVLDTVLSRCQVFDFKLASVPELVSGIKNVSLQEKRSIDDEAAIAIAHKAKGSFRDSLSILQKVLSRTPGDITLSSVLPQGESSDSTEAFTLFLHLNTQETDGSLMQSYSALKGHIETKDLIEELLEHTRTVLQLRYNPSFREELAHSASKERIALYQDMPNITSHTLRSLLEVYARALTSSRPEDSFEVFLYAQLEQWSLESDKQIK